MTTYTCRGTFYGDYPISVTWKFPDSVMASINDKGEIIVSFQVEITLSGYSKSSLSRTDLIQLNHSYQYGAGKTCNITFSGVIAKLNLDKQLKITWPSCLESYNNEETVTASGTWTIVIPKSGSDFVKEYCLSEDSGGAYFWLRIENFSTLSITDYEVQWHPTRCIYRCTWHPKMCTSYTSTLEGGDNMFLKVYVPECQEGQTKCEGYDLYKCQNGKWVLVERNSTQCGAPCTTVCETACQTACEQSCQTACELSCQEVCETACQQACETSCQQACEQSCQTACETACQTACELSCQQACETSCQTACEQSCQQSCELTSQACTVACETACQQTCEVSCQQACETSCQTTCETTSQAPAQNIVEMVANLLNISEEEAKRLLIGIGALIGIVFVVSLLKS